MVLPELGENVAGGDVVHVLVKPGDALTRDQPVLELETDKATIEVPSPLEGRVIEVFVRDGQHVKVGEKVLKVEALGGQPASRAPVRWQQVRAVPSAEGPEPEGTELEEYRSVTQADPHAPVGGLDIATRGRIRRSAVDKPGMLEDALVEAEAESALRRSGTNVVSFGPGKAAGTEEAAGRLPAPAAPSVRRVARELGVDIARVEGSGPGGRISAEDVKAHVKRLMSSGGPRGLAPATAPVRVVELPDFSKWGPVERRPMNNVRRKTAEHLSLAWSEIPHVTQFDKADVTALEDLRARYGKRVEAAGGKLTVTAVMLKVIAAALKAFPQFNASVDMASGEIVFKQYIHIGVAVDTERGLLVPVVRDVDRKTITELAAELAQASERARNRKTGLEEMQGGTFTISNLGGVGGTSFTPIVNHPEVAILGMSRSRVEPVFVDGEFVPRQLLPLSLSYDHRVIDGADGIRFLRWVCEAIEQPFLLAL
jgi:pyruvate dehydrogenase E2 component (dihydrolipoamide acetyltransferase)